MSLVYDNKQRPPVPERFNCEFVEENKLGQRVYKLIPTPRYMQLQQQYESLQNQMDPQVIFDFLQANPFIVDALYNMFEFFRLQGNFKEANAMLEQILYIYEDCFGYEFSKIFEDCDNIYCMQFQNNKFANSLFAALLKFVDLLGKKGCYRAALEYNKFLLKLNVEEDPAGALLCLDYNALSAKQYDYLEYFVKYFAKEMYKNNKYSILFMPNYIFSVALAKFAKIMLPVNENANIPGIGDTIKISKEDFEKALNIEEGSVDNNHNILLLSAVLLYPGLIKQLAGALEYQKSNVSHSIFTEWQKKSFKDVFGHKFFEQNPPYYAFLRLGNNQDVEGLLKIYDIYTERSKILWKDNKIQLWVKSVCGYILNMIEQNEFNYEEWTQKLVLSQNKNILPFALNRYKVLSKANFSENIERLDLNNIQDNNAQNPNDNLPNNYNPLNMNQGLLSIIAQSILPWYHLPQNQQQGEQNEQDLMQDIQDLQDEDYYEDDEEDNY